MLDGQYKPREWHVWGFPDEVRICFSDDFREYLFETLKKICGSRYRLARLLELHPMTVKEYELGKSSHDRPVFIPVFVLKELTEILRKYRFSSLIDDMEKHITKMRLEGGQSLIVYDPTLPIKESEELYSYVAHMIGDGCASGSKTPYYCGTDRKLIESFEKDLRTFGKFKTTEFIREDGTIYLSYPTVIARIVQYLLRVRFTKPHEIPEVIFTASDGYKISFLRAFYDDEGSVTGRRIYITQKSRKILEEIKILLKSLGIQTGRIGETQTKGHRFVIRMESYEKFYDLIKFEHLKRKKRLETLIVKIRSTPTPIKYKVLGLLQKTYPLTSYRIASQLGLRYESVIEAVCSLYEEGKFSKEYTSSRKPRLWYPKVLYVE